MEPRALCTHKQVRAKLSTFPPMACVWGAACGLSLALSIGCQGQIVGPVPTRAPNEGVDGRGETLGDRGSSLPASDIGAVAASCDPKATPSAEFAPLSRLTRRDGGLAGFV